MKRLLLVFLFMGPGMLLAQSTNAPLNSDYYHLIDRYEIQRGKIYPDFFSAWKPYQRKYIAEFVDSLKHSDVQWSATDRFNIEYLSNDNWEWADSSGNTSRKPFLKRFYRLKSDLYHVNTKDFDLHINPVLYFGGGRETESEEKTFINTRGVEVRGMIDRKLGFYSFIGENQAIFPQYTRTYIFSGNNVVPHEGFWKKFKDNGVDYFTARGYISFAATRHINLQFGHDRFKVGNGYRSMILSDYAPAYLFLKMQTQVWKINYTNLFTEMTADVLTSGKSLVGNGRYPKKYMALHHLGINIGKKLNVGVFESVIYSNADSLSDGHIELKYLNPIIFYRAVEQQNGSSDNVLLGMDFKWLAAKKVSFYGQLVLDEFLLENLKEGDGWWANKYSVQLGGEYIDAFGLNNLDLQLEGNLSRPYTYSHGDIYNNYSHYRQPLAHPLGANFTEVVALARYQPLGRLTLTGKLIFANYGSDTTGVNYGGNILKSNTTREMDRGNEIGQGIGNDLFFADFTASYQWKHNFFIDLKHLFRKVDSDLPALNQKTNYTSVALRWNIPQRLNEF
ncbi:hypothetical protein JMN32_12315 [Fulvivirga sp. 29W222]|uniref:Capsule assembly Wzi family protein n=1 Tax=Fulvivirga marina TaxID=2494733 RepID=A0A937FY23_9BACT|nr:hypothetical protein [Fulvivirga marina]MBL6447097.1 hypothetical protein [Fulvivirga marina]